MGLIEQCDTLTRLIRHGVEAWRDGDGDAATARATLSNIEELDKRVHHLAGAVEENERLRDSRTQMVADLERLEAQLAGAVEERDRLKALL